MQLFLHYLFCQLFFAFFFYLTVVLFLNLVLALLPRLLLDYYIKAKQNIFLYNIRGTFDYFLAHIKKSY